MRKRLPIAALGLLTAITATSTVGIAAAAPQATAAPVLAAPATTGLPVTLPATVGGVATTLQGTITGFANQAGQLVALTTIQGQSVAIPVTNLQAPGSCQILDLTLGPLDLDLLGLQVHLDQVHLNITAQQGPGNLLGNLLCAVTGLFDRGNLGQVSQILNRLLGLLTVL